MCEKYAVRPSDILDTDNELFDNEKIYLDYLISVARSEEASKTMDTNSPEYEEHLNRMKKTKGVKNRESL